MKKIAIVTINYNSEKTTQNFLDSIKKEKSADFSVKVIVVDNGSEKLFKTEDSVMVIRSEKNTGFSGGCNLGIKKAMDDGADYILLINNDTTVDQNLIKDLLEVFENDSKIGIATPKIYFSKGSEFHKDKYQKSDLGKVLWFAGDL